MTIAHAWRPCKPLGVKPRDAERSKNFFALGLISWMYTRPDRADARVDRAAVRARRRRCATPTSPRSRPGYNFGETAELFDHPTRSSPAQLDAGRLHATSPATPRWRTGLVAAGQQAKLPLFYASYPITPASDILHELSKHKNFGVRTLQAEDEIAGIGAALGAAFARPPRRHHHERSRASTSSPRRSASRSASSCRSLIIDIQRGGPSTGLPTKTEQADLLLAMYGRHGEAPLPIVRRVQPGALLRRRVRGGPHRAEVPHAGDPAVRRLPGQRRPSRGSCPTSTTLPDISVPFADRAEPHDDDGTRVLALPARPRDAGPAVGHPRHARPRCTASAASRRRTAPATSATTRRTTSAWSTSGPPRSPASPTTSRRSRSTATRRRRAAGARLGQHVGRHRARPSSRVRAPGHEGRPRAPRAPQPVPARTSARCCAATRRCSCPR